MHNLLGGALARRLLRPGFTRHVGLAFFVRALGAVSLFAMNLVVARALSTDEAGYFFLAFAMVTVLAQIACLGLESPVLRFVGAAAAEGDWARVAGMVRLSRRWVVRATLAVSVLLWFTAPLLADKVFGKPPVGDVLRVMAPSVVLVGMGWLIAHQLQALRLIPKSIFLFSIGVPLGVGGGVFLLHAISAEQAAWLHMASAAITLAIGVTWWLGKVPVGTVGRIDSREVLASCLPMWFAGGTALAIQWTGQFAAGVWASADEVAYLAVAQRTANLVSFVLIAVNLVAAPRFAALYREGRLDEMHRLVLRSGRLMLVIALPILLVLVVTPEWVMLLFGNDFADAAPLLVVLSVGQFINILTGSVGYLLAMSGHEKDMRNTAFLLGPFAIALALILTPAYGVMGAAVATAVAVATQNLIGVLLVRKRLGFNTLAVWRKI